MIKFNKLAKIAEDAGYRVTKMGDTQISVNDPTFCNNTPHDLVMFEDVFGWAIPFVASSKKFESKVLKDVRYYG